MLKLYHKTHHWMEDALADVAPAPYLDRLN